MREWVTFWMVSRFRWTGQILTAIYFDGFSFRRSALTRRLLWMHCDAINDVITNPKTNLDWLRYVAWRGVRSKIWGRDKFDPYLWNYILNWLEGKSGVKLWFVRGFWRVGVDSNSGCHPGCLTNFCAYSKVYFPVPQRWKIYHALCQSTEVNGEKDDHWGYNVKTHGVIPKRSIWTVILFCQTTFSTWLSDDFLTVSTIRVNLHLLFLPKVRRWNALTFI